VRARRWPHVLLGLWCAAVLAALTWPGYAWLGNHVDPLVLGLPFSLAWIVGWSLSTCAVLTAYFLHDRSDA
jgi:hypothetical protein